MDNIFDLELNEFRNSNHNLDLTGLSDLLPNDTEEIKNLSSKVQCLEQQLNQLMQTVSYCFDTINQFQTMNTKIETCEKLLNTTVSEVATLKRQSLWKLGNQTNTANVEESTGSTATESGQPNLQGLDQVAEDTCPGPDQVYNTQMGLNAIDTQESINVGDTSKIPDEPEAAAVPKSNDEIEEKSLPFNGLESQDPKESDGDVLDYVGVDNFDYAVYELNTTPNTEDDLGQTLNSLGAPETKEIYIEDFELDDLEPGDQNHLYSTLALDDLVKFGFRPRKNGSVTNNNAKVSSDSAKNGKDSSQADSDDDDDSETVDPCDICGKVVSRRKDMKRHMLTHVEKTGFPCPDCGKSFARKDAIKKHQKQNKCSKLDQVRYQTELLQGRRTVAVENSTPTPSDCGVCGKVFATRLKMKEHFRNIHEKDKHFRCKQCGKTFHRKVNLKAHLLKHENDSPCRCEKCGRVFARFFDLARHKKSHSGIKEHKCDICGAVFTRGTGLTNHRRIHQSESDDRNQICNKCGGAFKDLRALSKHNKMQHSEAPDKNGSNECNRSRNGVNCVDSDSNGENQDRQQLSELNQLKNITNGDESYQLFDSIGLPPLDEEFIDVSFK